MLIIVRLLGGAAGTLVHVASHAHEFSLVGALRVYVRSGDGLISQQGMIWILLHGLCDMIGVA